MNVINRALDAAASGKGAMPNNPARYFDWAWRRLYAVERDMTMDAIITRVDEINRVHKIARAFSWLESRERLARDGFVLYGEA